MIDYVPLWALLQKKEMKKTDLLSIVSPSTLAKLGKNANVETAVIDRICGYLSCDVSDVMRYVPDEEMERIRGRK